MENNIGRKVRIICSANLLEDFPEWIGVEGIIDDYNSKYDMYIVKGFWENRYINYPVRPYEVEFLQENTMSKEDTEFGEALIKAAKEAVKWFKRNCK